LARVFAVMVQILLSSGAIAVQVLCERYFITGYKFYALHWRSVAIQTVSEPGIYHGAGFQLSADERVRVQEPLQICLRCRSKAKTVTSLLNIPSALYLPQVSNFLFLIIM
jgi:hypothetical protein